MNETKNIIMNCCTNLDALLTYFGMNSQLLQYALKSRLL